MISIIIFSVITYRHYTNLLFFISFIPLFIHLLTVIKTKNPVDLDPELKKVALSTFLFAILFSLGQIL